MSNLMEKVDSLQRAHEEFTHMVGIEYNKLVNVQTRLEMKIDRYIEESKENFRQYQEENRKAEQQRKEEFRKYEEKKEKEEQQRKEEFRKHQEENKQDKRELNKRMGELSKKFGTIVEDMVVPSLPRIIQEKFAILIDDYDVERNRRFKKDGRNKEFDAYAVTQDCVFLNYTVATLKNIDFHEIEKEIKDFRFFLPGYADKKIIGILAALHIPDNLLDYAEKKGYLVLGLGEYLMEVKNRPNFIPKKF
ncbi:MAG: hypothetical protein AAF518_12080 [Spirochaetota bacterium]